MSDCNRWIVLSDREALGEALSVADREFLLAHARTCAECGAEHEVWQSLERAGASVESEKPPPPRALQPKHRSRRAFAALAFASAAAGVVALGVMRMAAHAPAAPAPAALAPAESSACVELASGDVDVDGRQPPVGARLVPGAVVSTRAGSACLRIDEGVRACLGPGSRVRVVELARPDRRLEVLVGKVVAELEPQPSGTTFALQTRDGSATAIGTAFSVEVPDGEGPSVTRVLHGTVLVRGRDAAQKRVGPHDQATMTGSVVPSAAADEARDWTALVPAMASGALQPCVVRVESSPATATVRIDDRVVGTTPLAILLDPGEHAVTLEAAQSSLRDVVRLGPGERLDRRFDLRPAPVEARTAIAPVPTAIAPPPEPGHGATADALSLLRAAREAGARGAAAGAAAAYRELLARYPSSPEATASELPYGELQLGSLADPAGALRTFERYLAHGGPLQEEAAYGRIRALRALGRQEEESAAIAAFLSAYPDGATAAALRLRARDLEVPR
jgi:ferric-dicitrate binding protein FerR (iron transport regulator)